MKLSPFKLERFFAQYEFKAPYLLSSSDCESMTIEELLAYEPQAEEELRKTWLGYSESQGHPQLRQEIAQTYQQITAEDILVHAGAEEAIFNFINAMLEPEDHVIVHFPCYQSLREIASSIGARVTLWQTNEIDRWELDLDELQAKIQPNTKLIIINCPHNPTGYVMNRQKLEKIVAIARQHDIFLFSDEVYRFLERNEADTLPAACDLYEKAVSLGVMSKSYGLAGLRIGWIATRDRQIYQAMAQYKDYTSICNSAPSEFLAILALRHREKIVRRNRTIIAANLEECDRFFTKYESIFNWISPKRMSEKLLTMPIVSA
jgi:aspartate/methionine/tyrosine aminotransferase